jgi:hypothetical protein
MKQITINTRVPAEYYHVERTHLVEFENLLFLKILENPLINLKYLSPVKCWLKERSN